MITGILSKDEVTELLKNILNGEPDVKFCVLLEARKKSRAVASEDTAPQTKNCLTGLQGEQAKQVLAMKAQFLKNNEIETYRHPPKPDTFPVKSPEQVIQRATETEGKKSGPGREEVHNKKRANNSPKIYSQKTRWCELHTLEHPRMLAHKKASFIS